MLANKIRTYLSELHLAITETDWRNMDELSNVLFRVRLTDNTLFVCGNGGSFAVAMHWGVDLPKVCNINVVTLGMNPSLLTALSNDDDYSQALATELLIRARPGDALVALSVSGGSSNIRAVLNAAERLNMERFLLTGKYDPKKVTYPGTLHVRVASEDYGVVEDVFSAIGHGLTRKLKA